MDDLVRDGLLLDFLARFLADRDAGQLRSLSGYLRDFPGIEEDVARHFLAFRDPKTEGAPPPDTHAEQRGAMPAPRSTADDGTVGERTAIGPYRLEGELGYGGQGTVYLATDRRLGRPVALKVLRHSARSGDQDFLRFRREAELASRLDHPGICPVYDVGIENGASFIAMRRIEGTSFARFLKDRPPPATKIEFDALAALVEKVARALDAAHEIGIVHRDVKPGNIMIDTAGEPVVLDFGLARDLSVDAASLTESGAVFGTPAYMSPEQCGGGAPPIDRQTDVWALGVILYQASTGRLPFEGPTLEALRARIAEGAPEDPRRRNPAVPRDLAVIAATALETDRSGRYRTAATLAEDLRRFRAREPILARPAGPWLRMRRWSARNPRLALAIGLLLVAVGVAVLFWTRARRSLVRFEQAADTIEVRRLLDAEEDLYPIEPAMIPRADRWLAGARSQLDRRAAHAAARAELVGGDPGDQSRRWLALVLDGLLVDLDRLEARLPVVVSRREEALALAEPPDSVAWASCIAAIRDSAAYGGLRLTPQPGLIPLHEDPRSGLFEFLHRLSGEAPRWNERRESWVVAERTGIVLVLVPGGRYPLGLDPKPADAARPDYRPRPEEPRHEVELAPFFLSKYELTQAQWMRLDEGRNPSRYGPETAAAVERFAGDEFTLTNPVDSISWEDAVRALRRVGLQLPTEAQWEVGTSADTSPSWWFSGPDPRVVSTVANIAGEEAPALWHGGQAFGRDRHRYPAPVGCYGPNPWGFHDQLGNSWEWCRDALVRSYASGAPRRGDGLREPPSDEGLRIMRGGCFRTPAGDASSQGRGWQAKGSRLPELSVRAARAVDP